MIYTIFPLGNPTEKYSRTRHNSGRFVADLIEEDIKSLNDCEIFVSDNFMNESGEAISKYLKYHEGRELIIIYDDKDLPFGSFRISFGRGDGGHNGLKNIIDNLGKKDFVRIRIGIAPIDTNGKEKIAPHGKIVKDYVLSNLKEDEEECLRKIAKDVLLAIKTIVKDGYKKAMEKHN